MYVTLMFRAKGTRLTKPTLCLVLLSLAVLVGVIRVTEHRNHWNDVLAGFITGGAIAAFLVRERERESERKKKRIWLERATSSVLTKLFFPSGDVCDQQFPANPPGGADSPASAAARGHGGDPSPQPASS